MAKLDFDYPFKWYVKHWEGFLVAFIILLIVLVFIFLV
jgi:hypothetical protein